MAVASEDIPFYPHGVAKVAPHESASSPNEMMTGRYAKPWRFLGKLMGFQLTNTMVGTEQPALLPEGEKTQMGDFIQALNRHHNLGDHVVARMKDVAETTKRRIYKELEHMGWDLQRLHVVTLPEVSWEPSSQQEKRLQTVLSDPAMAPFATGIHDGQGTPYESLAAFARAAVSDKKFAVPVADFQAMVENDLSGRLRRTVELARMEKLLDAAHAPAAVGLADIVRILRHVPEEDWYADSKPLTLLRFAVDASPYSFLDISKITRDREFDPNKIPKGRRKGVLSAAARSDYLMLAADKDDPEALALIQKFEHATKGSYWGSNPMLDPFGKTGTSQDALGEEMALFIQQKRVRFVMIELKTRQFTNRVKDGNVLPFRDDEDFTLSRMGDEAHTLWAMNQWLMHGVGVLSSRKQSKAMREAAQAMRNFNRDTNKDEAFKRALAIRNAYKDLYGALLNDPNGAMIVEVALPFFEWKKKRDRPATADWRVRWGSEADIEATLPTVSQHEIRVQRLRPWDQLRLVAEYGRNLIPKAMGVAGEVPSLPHTRRILVGSSKR